MQSRNRSIDRSQPSFTRSLSKRLTQSMDRGLAAQTQHNDSTPGSVNTAALNHFNRMKPHMSISNLQPQQQNQQQYPQHLQQQQHQQHNSSNLNNYDLRESQEELEMEDGADYDVNDANAAAAARQLHLNPIISPRRSQQQIEANNNNNNNPTIVTSSGGGGGGGGFRTGANLQPKTNQNFSNRSTASSSSNNANANNNANTRRIPFENVQNNQQQDFDQLDEYYTVGQTLY
jgi:hypothetical protein